MTLKIFIVENHPIMRRTLNDFINSRPGLEVAGTAETAAEALERLAEVEADLALVDVRLSETDGIQLVAQLREKYPGLLCLMLSGHNEVNYVRHAFQVGAHGYILKGKPPEVLEAIQKVAGGETYLSPALQARLAGADGQLL